MNVFWHRSICYLDGIPLMGIFEATGLTSQGLQGRFKPTDNRCAGRPLASYSRKLINSITENTTYCICEMYSVYFQIYIKSYCDDPVTFIFDNRHSAKKNIQ